MALTKAAFYRQARWTLGLLGTFLAFAISGCGGSTGSGSTVAVPAPTATPSVVNEWTWMGGSSSVANATGVYGTQGLAATTNIPGGRGSAVSWTDNIGDFWLFGGGAYQGGFNDLWEFNPSTEQWTWVSGSDTFGSAGVYGMKGVAVSGNIPSSRVDAVSWIDTNGNLWLFGGLFDGNVAYVNTSDLNDLWEFNPTAKTWTWVSGGTAFDAPGVYGSLGMPAASNVPGARFSSTGWTDISGNFWLFGGEGYDSTGRFGGLSDLWKFDPAAKQWTWVSGSSKLSLEAGVGVGVYGAPAVYGTQGVAAATNDPGSRWGSSGWADASGNFWLFAGSTPSATVSNLNDLWEYTPATKQWTWVSGSNKSGVVSVGDYGIQGISASTNVPGGRYLGVSWFDPTGNLWLYGGQGNDSTGMVNGYLNDLWKFNLATKQWTWVSGASAIGANKVGQSGVYGTLGTPAATNVPGGRVSSISWIDNSGKLWLLGGDGFDSTGSNGSLNDFWRYQP